MNYSVLKKLLKVAKPYTQRYLEIGSLHGESLTMACKINRKMEVHSVDKALRGGLKKTLERFPHIKFHRISSLKIDWSTLGEFDSIFVDGGHSYEIAKNDIVNSWELWNRNGIFFGDDYDPKHGVFQAVNEFFDIHVDTAFRSGRDRLSLDEVLPDADMKILKDVRECKGGYLQIFAAAWVWFTPEFYEKHYQEILDHCYPKPVDPV